MLYFQNLSIIRNLFSSFAVVLCAVCACHTFSPLRYFLAILNILNSSMVKTQMSAFSLVLSPNLIPTILYVSYYTIILVIIP